jgi:hypothetical protein
MNPLKLFLSNVASMKCGRAAWQPSGIKMELEANGFNSTKVAEPGSNVTNL